MVKLLKISQRTKSLIIVGCLVMTLTGCSLFPVEEETLAPPLIKPVKVSRELYEVTRGNIAKEVKGMGNFESNRIEYYKFKSGGGRLKEIYVAPGEFVKKGDVLMVLEPEGLELELKQKLLDVEKAQLALDEVKEQGLTKLFRIRMLELDIAQTIYDTTYERMQNKQIIAGMNGQLIFIDSAKPGDQISNEQTMAIIADASNLRLSYQGEASIIRDVEVGMKASITINKEKYEGIVTQTPSSAPLVENEQQKEVYSRTLYISVKNVPKGLEIGQLADIVIRTAERTNIIKIPKRGLRSYIGRYYVQLMDGESINEMDVEKGLESATEVEIMSGLKEGQQVILQ